MIFLKTHIYHISLTHTHTYVRSYFEGVNAEDIVGMATTAYLSLPTVEKRLLRDK